MRVYVAGPYTLGDRSENVRKAMLATDRLIASGHEPFCPLLFHFQDLAFPRPWQDWIRVDLAWLPFAEALIRLPGESEGADIEVARARELGIPIIHSVGVFVERMGMV